MIFESQDEMVVSHTTRAFFQVSSQITGCLRVLKAGVHVSGLTSDFGVGNLQNYQARSSGGEHYPDTVGVVGSNPTVPTSEIKRLSILGSLFFCLCYRFAAIFAKSRCIST